MKTKKLFFLFWTMLALVACVPNNDIEEATLNLSEAGPIVLENIEASKTITVTTNQPKFTAFSKSDWLDVVISGNDVTITASKNEEPRERRTKLFIIAGSAAEEVQILQNASGVSLNIITQEESGNLSVTQWSGQQIIDIDVNTDKWEVASDSPEWCRVRAKQFKKQIVIDVDENVKRESRTAKITVVVEQGKLSKDFYVIQSGIMYYILPYLDFKNGTRGAITEFETERRSIISGSWAVDYEFTTKSPAFNKITYAVAHNKLMSLARLEASTAQIITGNQKLELIDFLKEKGFTEKKTDDVFYNSELRVLADIKNTYMPHVMFTYIPEQTESYETFAAFPYGFIKWGATRKEIEDYEAKNGGTYKYDPEWENEKDGRMAIQFITNDKEVQRRLYMLERDKDGNFGLLGTFQHFLLIDRAYYIHNGNTYLTNEFRELLKKEGFEYITTLPAPARHDEFHNKSKELRLLTRVARYEGSANAVLEIVLSPLTKVSNKSVPSSLISTTSSLSEKILKLNKSSKTIGR